MHTRQQRSGWFAWSLFASETSPARRSASTTGDTFHVPPFLIDGGNVVEGQRGIAGDQIQHTRAAVFVCEDLLDQQEREGDSFQIYLLGAVVFKHQRVHSDIFALSLIFQTQRYLAIGFERHDEILLQGLLDKHHVLSRGKPHIVQHVLEWDLVVHRLLHHLPRIVILGNRAAPLGLAILLVYIMFGLGNQGKFHGQRHPATVIERRHEVDPLHSAIFRRVVVPTYHIILVGVGLLFEAVIYDYYPLLSFHLAYLRLDPLPQIGRASLCARQHPRDLVMAHLPLHQLRQPRRRRCSKRPDQVVSVQVKQGIVHYIHLRCSSLHKSSSYGPYRVR